LHRSNPSFVSTINTFVRHLSFLAREHNIPLSNILILHDELEKKLGTTHLKSGGSTSGHNGLKSIQSSFQSASFDRLRIGIDRPDTKDREEVGRYVLGRFKETEMDVLERVSFPLVEQIVKDWVIKKCEDGLGSSVKGG
jgi:PTH1 family peptidyl-tRNA hydrolase